MLANMEIVQCITETIKILEARKYRFAVQLRNLEVDRIYNGRSTMHQEQDLMRSIVQTERAVHSLKTKRGMLYKAMRDNQLSLTGD